MNAAQLIEEIVCQYAASVAAEPVTELQGRAVCAGHLARLLADVTKLSLAEAWESLCHVPSNMLSLLDSPQGWTALGGLVAAEHGIPAPLITPHLH